VYITAFAPALWQRLKAAAGLVELDDERFATQTGRLEHNDELQAVLTAWTLGKTSAELHELALAGYPFTVSQTPASLLASEQWRNRRVAQRTAHPAAGEVTVLGAPWFDDEPRALSPAPRLGEGDAELLEAAMEARG